MRKQKRSSGLPTGTAPACIQTVAVGGLVPLVLSQAVSPLPQFVQTIIFLAVLFLAVIVHEVSHGLVAERLGDPTARRMGRLTLNPIPHIDLFGTIIIPAFLLIRGSRFMIGWAKPVPVDIRRFRNPLRDFAITSLGGPVSNLLQVVAYVVLFRIYAAAGLPYWVGFVAYAGALVNLLLALFNLIPIPPLDGSRLVAAMLPTDLAVRYLSIDRFGFMIIFALLFLGVFRGLVGFCNATVVAILG